jgi:transcriptional regulator with XRE-family HTH domain
MIFHYDFLIVTMKYNFKENLRNELDYQGITVKELSARTGIPIASLDCYLGNRATLPSVVAAIKIAKALNVTVEYLVISKNAGTTRLDKRLGRETQELINWVENLNMEQKKAVLKLVKTFKENHK